MSKNFKYIINELNFDGKNTSNSRESNLSVNNSSDSEETIKSIGSLEIAEDSTIAIGTNYFAKVLNSKIPGQGTFIVDWIWPDIRMKSGIVASVCERAGTSSHMGLANMQVLNVVPKDGRVYFRINIDWPDGPLDYRVHVVVFNNV